MDELWSAVTAVLISLSWLLSSMMAAGWVQISSMLVREGGYTTGIVVAVWLGCPAVGVWVAENGVPWMAAGMLTGIGVMLEADKWLSNKR